MSVGEYEASLRERAIAARRRLFNGRPPVVAEVVATKPVPVVTPKKKPKRVSLVERMLREKFPRAGVSATVMAVCKSHDVAPMLVAGTCRTKDVVAARNEIFSRLWEGGLSVERIGHAFGKDHTTVLHGIRRHRGESAADIRLRKLRKQRQGEDFHTEEILG